MTKAGVLRPASLAQTGQPEGVVNHITSPAYCLTGSVSLLRNPPRNSFQLLLGDLILFFTLYQYAPVLLRSG